MSEVRRAARATFLVLAGCGGPAPAPELIPLSYSDGLEVGSASFSGLQRIAERVAYAYVRVVVLAPIEDDRVRKPPLRTTAVLNGASGVIVDRRGYIATAAHIAVRSGLPARVTTIDGVSREGQVVHVARGRELAVLRIEPFPGMRVARMADSLALREGQPVFTIGTPDNRAGVVTPGTVSNPRLGRRIEYAGFGYEDAIELAMKVEPGHSGGPLFDAGGRLVGMVASFGLGDTRRVPYTSTRIAYAVPASDLKAYLAAALPR